MSTLARFVVWTCALELLWALYAGTTQSTELIAGLVAAAVASLFVEALRAHGLLRFRFSGRAVASAWKIPGQVVFDFGLVLWLLVREGAHGRRVRGVWVTAPFEEEPGPQGRFRRALATAVENETANAVVVDIDDGLVLLHSLDTRVKSGREVM